MGVIAVLVAALVGYVLGAVWYMLLSKPWMAAANVSLDAEGKLKGGALPYVLSAIAMLLVAGMMRHVFALSSIDTWDKGLLSGLGIGLFFISPWIMINNAYSGRPFQLTLIDSGYAVLGCAAIGTVLTLF